MDVQSLMLNGALDAIVHFHPEYGPFIGWFKSHEADFAKLIPIVEAAATEGTSAFDAAEKAAPTLTAAIRHFVSEAHVADNGRGEQLAAEGITRTCFGMPAMTPSQQQSWLDSSSPPDDRPSGSS